MFMQIPIEGISLQIGIRLAQSAFGRCSHGTKTFPYESGPTIELQACGTTNTRQTETEADSRFTAIPETLFKYITDLATSNSVSKTNFYELPVLWYLLRTLRSCERDTSYIQIFSIGVVTVRALYAGTLVNFWTTAPSHQKRHSSTALLAAFCFILATLTIAARCYASKNATHPLAQLSLQPQSLSSVTIKDSKFQTLSSKIVLSRIFRFPTKDKDKQSDIRIILKSSKNLLSTQNFNLKTRNRRKREVDENKSFNTFHSYDGKYLANHDSVLYDVEIQSTKHPYPINSFYKTPIPSRNLKKEQSIKYLSEISDRVTSENNSDNSAWNISENSPISGTLKIVHRQSNRNSELLTEETGRSVGGVGIERPMPPVLDHNSNSLNDELYFAKGTHRGPDTSL
ncbi:hypothetical protein FQR65_LT03841 [Abscondita terminalis]|nr:hypothetical protein FQR65_LT03841 [Abscondita terminalis]